jgi:hypothetical protein
MSKFNVTTMRAAAGRGPITAEPLTSLRTFEGAPAHARDARSDLFMLAVTNLVGENTCYEKAGDRDERFRGLVRQVAVDDGLWMLGFLRWLRADANMRSASLVAAAEAVHARLDLPATPAYETGSSRGLNRAMVDVVCQRADEPGEFVAYWVSRYGRTLPKPVKRGLADAVRRLYREYSLLKYDTASHAVRFADVLELTHPNPVAPWQGDLFRYALDRRHGHDTEVPLSLRMIQSNLDLRAELELDPTMTITPELLRNTGMTWEDILSLLGSKVNKAKLWEALIPSMGLFALARNLRNFDEAGVRDEVAAIAAARFADPEQVGKSRMFPYRWLAAYQQAPSLRWAHALDQALQASLANLPELRGRTAVLVDTSGSMLDPLSGKSTMTRVMAAAVFGVALAAKNGQADLFGFADGVFQHVIPAGASVIREVTRFVSCVGTVGHGTNLAGSIQVVQSHHGVDHYDRYVVVSDMQTMTGPVSPSHVVPARVPLYGVNLGGYAPTVIPGGVPNRVEIGGLTDATFKMLPLIEAGRNADWPF